MSFLTRAAGFRAARFSIPSTAARFHTASRLQKGPVEAGKDALKTADRKVSDTLVSGIEAGEKGAQKAKEAAGMTGAQAKGEAKGKAAELEGKAKAAKEEIKAKI